MLQNNLILLKAYIWIMYKKISAILQVKLSHVQLFVILWTIACKAPLSMEFSRPEYWSGYSLIQGIFPTQGSNWCLLHCRQILYLLSHRGVPPSLIFPWCSYWIAAHNCNSKQIIRGYSAQFYTKLSNKWCCYENLSRSPFIALSSPVVLLLFSVSQS